MSDGNGPTFDQEFDRFDRVLAGFPILGELRAFMVTVRSEMGSRQLLISQLEESINSREDEIEAVCALTGSQVRDGTQARIDAAKKLKAEVGHLRLLLGWCPECGTSLVWYYEDGLVRCDPDVGCVWVGVSNKGKHESRGEVLRRLADEWKVTR